MNLSKAKSVHDNLLKNKKGSNNKKTKKEVRKILKILSRIKNNKSKKNFNNKDKDKDNNYLPNYPKNSKFIILLKIFTELHF